MRKTTVCFIQHSSNGELRPYPRYAFDYDKVCLLGHENNAPRGYNKLYHGIPSHIPKCSTLQTTELKKYPECPELLRLELVGDFKSFPMELSHAVVLDITKSNISEIPAMPNLTTLYASRSHITKISEDCPQLRFVEIEGVEITASVVKGLKNITTVIADDDWELALIGLCPSLSEFNGNNIESGREIARPTKNYDSSPPERTLPIPLMSPERTLPMPSPERSASVGEGLKFKGNFNVGDRIIEVDLSTSASHIEFQMNAQGCLTLHVDKK